MSLRTRLTSFLAGFALAGGATFYQLHKDINTSSEYLAAQAQETRAALEARVAALEAVVGTLVPAAAALPPPAEVVAAAAAAPAEVTVEEVIVAEPVS